MRVDKRKAEEAHPISRAQSPKATMSTNNGLKNIGYSKGAIFLTDAKQMGQFNQEVAITQPKSASVKGKKEFAHIYLESVVASPTNSPKQTSFASTSNFSYGTSSRGDPEFLFTSPTRNEMGNKFGGNSHRNSRGSHHGNPSKPDPCHGVVQHQGEKSLEIHISTHEGECSEGLPANDGPTLGKDSKSVVGISNRWSFAE